MSQEVLVDLENRDPNNLNDHVKVTFDDILGEPDSSHSVDCVWINSYKCFECCKSCCYKLLTIIFGLPLSIFWGIEFAVITFWHVWVFTPYLKAYMIECGCLQKFYSACLACYLQPLCEACGFFFTNIKVTSVKD